MLRRAALSPVFMLACAARPGLSAAESAGAQSTTSEGGVESSDTSESETESGGDTERVDALVGHIVDEAGAPVLNANAQAFGPVTGWTAEQSVPIGVDDAGCFTFEAPRTGLWALKLLRGPWDGAVTGLTLQLPVEEGVGFELGELVVPALGEILDLTDATGEIELVFDERLTLRFDLDQAQAPGFTPITQLGAVTVDPELLYIDDVEGRPVHAAWAFGPYGTRTLEDSAFTVELTSDLGLMPGEQVYVYALTTSLGYVLEVARGSVVPAGGAIELTQTDLGLTELTWLLVTR